MTDVHRFDDIAKVDVGIVTGANKFFLVSDDDWSKNLQAQKNGRILCSVGASIAPASSMMIVSTQRMLQRAIRQIFYGSVRAITRFDDGGEGVHKNRESRRGYTPAIQVSRSLTLVHGAICLFE